MSRSYSSTDFDEIYKTYIGNEPFINNSVETGYSMMDYWRWTLSCIYESTTRGGFAEYIVKIALDEGGINLNPSGKTGMELYDLVGPKLKSTGKPARIEVKSTSRYHINRKNAIVPTKTQQFGIAKKRTIDERGNFPDSSPKQRNNDIYVFVMFNGDGKGDSFFDLSQWDFYVMPTVEIDNDPVYCDRSNIRLNVVQERCKKLSFEELPTEVIRVCGKL